MGNPSLAFDLPWSALCSDNRKYVTGYILSKQYREAKAAVRDAAIVASKAQRWAMTDVAVRLDVEVREPDKRRRDLNFQKALMDAITESGTVWHDDSQVRQMCWTFAGRDKARAGATVTITILASPPLEGKAI